MKVKQINIVSSLDGDWEGIYLNGEIQAQGHSITIWDWIDILSEITGVDAVRQDFDFEEAGESWLPEKYDHLPEEHLIT